MIASSVPRAAPNHFSAWPSVLAPLSTKIGRRDHVPQHRLDRNRVPADALAVHHRVLGAGDQAGHRHADAEDRFLGRPGLLDDRADAARHVRDHVVRVQARTIEHGHVGRGQMPGAHGQPEIE